MQTSVLRAYLPAVLILLLAGEVIFLLLQNRELKERLNQMTRPARETLKKGDRVSPTTLTMLDGSKMEIEYVDPSERYLFFVFSTTCPYCEKNLVNWSEIAGTIIPEGTYVLGVSTHELEQTKEYVASKDVQFFPTVCDTSFIRQYKTFSVPQTILVHGKGIVAGVWPGVLSVEQKAEIINLLGAQTAPLNHK